jgi:hypothetical protein
MLLKHGRCPYDEQRSNALKSNAHETYFDGTVNGNDHNMDNPYSGSSPLDVAEAWVLAL